MQDSIQGYVVSDICDTLFYSNTTFDFIRFCVEKNWLPADRQRRWRLLLRRKAPLFWVLAVLNKLRKADYHKQVAVGLLEGYAPAIVRKWAATFYTEYLLPRKVAESFSLLQELADHTELVLASSSIEPVVAEIANALHVHQYVATTLEVKAGTYTGRIAQDLTGKKPQALLSLLQQKEHALLAVLSDNTTDRSLMELAANGYAVCYNDTQRKFWNRIPGITLLEVKEHVA